MDLCEKNSRTGATVISNKAPHDKEAAANAELGRLLQRFSAPPPSTKMKIMSNSESVPNEDKMSHSDSFNDHETHSLSEDSDDIGTIHPDSPFNTEDQDYSGTQDSLSSEITRGVTGNNFTREQTSAERGTEALEIPATIVRQLEAWYAKKGHSPPPCACSIFYLHHLTARNGARRVFWQHSSGEILDVDLYPIPGLKLRSGERKRQNIIVVSGPALGHRIVKFAKTTGSGITLYRIWLGLDGGDSAGFEREPSVRKVVGVRPAIDNVPASPVN